MNEIIWKPMKVSRILESEIVVAGGGTAGVIAAIAAARMGRKVTLAERCSALGGTQTMALVTPIMPEGAPLGNAESYISKEIRSRLTKKGCAHKYDGNYSSWFEPEMLKAELEEMAHQAGVQVLLETELVDAQTENGRITALLLHQREGLAVLRAEQFIDCTGDGALAVMAGAEYSCGGPDGMNQAVSLRYEMSGVNLKRFGDWLRESGQTDEWTTPPLISTYRGGCPGFDRMIARGIADGAVTEEDMHYVQLFTLPGREDAVNFNCPELGNSENVLNSAFISDRLYEGKKSILRCAEFYRRYIPGFEKSSLSKIAPMLGIRESRRIHCVYDLSIDDIFAYRKFEDGISISDYKIDIHGNEKCSMLEGKQYNIALPRKEWYFTLPYRSLIVKGISNLLTAGRCAGADFFAQSAIRVQHMCRYMGEAAGIGAAIASEYGITPAEVDGRRVREEMKRRGADL